MELDRVVVYLAQPEVVFAAFATRREPVDDSFYNVKVSNNRSFFVLKAISSHRLGHNERQSRKPRKLIHYNKTPHFSGRIKTSVLRAIKARVFFWRMIYCLGHSY